MPSLRIRGDDRTPVLRYNSTQATPTPVVAAELSAPTGGATNVTAALTVRRGGSDVAPEDAVTRVDGPRTDKADVTRIATDRFGAPW
jgi:hypothetical protein